MSLQHQEAFDWNSAYASRGHKIKASEIRELLKILERPEVISFAGGIPDPELFPVNEFRAACDEVLASNRESGAGLQYAITEGYLPLREWLAAYMGRRGVECTADNIILTSGSQQAIDFLSKLFIGPGDTMLVTAPTYLGALQVFNAYEANFDHLSFKEQPPAAYYRGNAQRKNSRIAAAYAVMDFSNPTGETLSTQERAYLLDLAHELNIPIFEDAAYEAIRFEGERIPSCLALDIERCGSIDKSRVIYCGSFSKTMVPGLRMGWICAAKDLIHKVALIKQGADLHTAWLNQMIMHRVAERVFDKQVETARKTYKAKRDTMLASLANEMPSGLQWTKPEGGMFVWMTMPEHINGAELLAHALESANVAFVPGGAFFACDPKHNTIRINYSRPSHEEIATGIKRLAATIETFRPRGA